MGTLLKAALAALEGQDIQVGDVLHTKDGGLAVKYKNKTGALSIKGMLVELSHVTEKSVQAVIADEPDPIGAIYENGIADGADVWVVVSGKAYVLLQNSTSASIDYWVRVSVTVAGRADATNAAPPGGTINAIEGHFKEIGHCMEDVSAGVDKLALITLHFN